jgi:hypothetical protein
MRKEVAKKITEVWEIHRKKFIEDAVPRMTNCWNSARDKNGNRFKGVKLLDRNDISRLEMDKVLLRALRTGDFSEIGLIYNSIVETSCRHTQHTGPLGKKGFNTVSIKDRCSKIEKVVDRREIGKSGSSKKKKEIIVCKRRYPKPILDDSCIYQDPHKKSIYVLSTPTNDPFFNSALPDRVLYHLSNCDDKPLIPAFFRKPPKPIWKSNEDGTYALDLEFPLGDVDSENYTIKYSLKGSRGMSLPTNILMAATENLQPDEPALSLSTMNRAYNSLTLGNLTCLFNVVHVAMELPLIFSNVSSIGINSSGVMVLRKDYKTNIDGDDYTKSKFSLFNKRFTHMAHSVNEQTQREVQAMMSMHELFDRFTVKEKVVTDCPIINETPCPLKGKRHLVFTKRKKEINGFPGLQYRATHMTPRVEEKHMNPKRKHYWQTCQNILLYSTPCNTIDEIMINRNNYSSLEEYGRAWIRLFDETFPNGVGLQPHLLAMYRKYHKKGTTSEDIASESEEDASEVVTDDKEYKEKIDDSNLEDKTFGDDEMEEDIDFDREVLSEDFQKEKVIQRGKQFYQTQTDKLVCGLEDNPAMDEWESEKKEEVPQVNPPGKDFQEWLEYEAIDANLCRVD